MRLRKQALGNRNLIGARVEAARKSKGIKQKELLAQLQVNGVDMNASGLSKLEGQIRSSLAASRRSQDAESLDKSRS